MKITIYALHLGIGGVEKYITTLANMLSEQHRVEIVSTYKMQNEPAFTLDSRVKVRYLLLDKKPNKEALRQSIRSRNVVHVLKEVIRSLEILYLKSTKNISDIKKCESDIIISTRVFHNKLIGKYAKREIIKITGEHNHHNNNDKYIRQVVKSCKGFDYFIPISKELADFYSERMKEIGVQTRYIRFCIDENTMYETPDFNGENLISVGRLSPEKGMCDLVRVFEKVHKLNDRVKLNIVGDGEEKDSIQQLIKEKNLEDCVILHGYQDKKNIYTLMKKMSIYIMTSFTESFGIVLLEAMSCGIPCIAFSSAQGAHEIIQNGFNGWLIENRNQTEMCTMINRLLDDKTMLKSLSKHALQTAEKYSYRNTKIQWLDLMAEIQNKGEIDHD